MCFSTLSPVNHKKQTQLSTMRRQENKRRINTSYIIELNEYCRKDKDINTCRTKLHDDIFRHEWHIGWFREHEEIMTLPMFNQPFFKEALKRFYAQADDSIRRFKFFGYYVVKDLERWLVEVGRTKEGEYHEGDDELLTSMVTEGASLRIETSVTDSPLVHYDRIKRNQEEEEEINLARVDDEMTQLRENILRDMPFGVIPIALCEEEMCGSYMLVVDGLKMQKSLVFESNDEDRSAYYDYRVMDMGAAFKFPDPREDAEAGILISYGYNELVPISPFIELMKQKERIKEAELALFDANSMLTYRDGYMIARPLPLAQSEAISEANLYAFDDLLEARQSDSLRQQDVAMNNAHSQMQRLNMRRSIQAASGGGGNNTRCTPFGKGASSVSWDRRLQFNRPAANETLEYIPQSVEIPSMASPSPIVNVDARIRKYELDVCTVMNLPYVFFKPCTHNSGENGNGGTDGQKSVRMGSTSHNDMYQKLLESEVHNQQTLFSTLFNEVYTRTFSRLDYRAFPMLRRAGAEPTIHFINTLVKSDDAIKSLLPFYHAGLIPGVEIRRFLFKNYDIKLDPEIEPTDAVVRKILKAKRQLPKESTVMEEDEEPLSDNEVQ